jgi:hypothetical protein
MSIEILKNEVRRFLSLRKAEVLCITGKWGVGKTYSWKHCLKDALDNNSIALDRYTYVSLFGISSLDDLKYAIFENTVRKDNIEAGANTETFQMMLESSEVLGRKSAYWILKLTEKIPYLKYLSLGGAHRIFSLFIRNQIICIDDLDRKGKNLEVSDVLGLINFLKEERNCKIALVLDEDALYNAIPDEKKKGEFRKYFEKVVDISLKFDPTAEESIEIALQEKTSENNLISEDCIKLGISNIRIIRKIERLVKKVTPLLKDFDEQVFRQSVHSLTLLGWSLYAPDTMAPSLEYLKGKNEYDNLALSKGKTISKEEAAWNALLEAYGFSSMDELDYLLLNGVQNGFFDPEEIKEAASIINEKIKARKSAESFWQAWETYHDSFDNNSREVTKTIYKSFIENVQYLSPGDLNATVWLLKELGEAPKAVEIIKYYTENRKGDRRFWDLDYYMRISQINDPDVIEAFRSKYASFKKDIDANELILKMAEARGWSNEELIMASELIEDEYYRLFKSQKGDKLRLIISFCLQFDKIAKPSSEMKLIADRAKEALIHIGKESDINALRVNKYVGSIDKSASDK